MYLSRIFVATSVVHAFTRALATVVIQAKKISDPDHENVCHRLAYYLVRPRSFSVNTQSADGLV